MKIVKYEVSATETFQVTCVLHLSFRKTELLILIACREQAFSNVKRIVVDVTYYCIKIRAENIDYTAALIN